MDHDVQERQQSSASFQDRVVAELRYCVYLMNDRDFGPALRALNAVVGEQGSGVEMRRMAKRFQTKLLIAFRCLRGDASFRYCALQVGWDPGSKKSDRALFMLRVFFLYRNELFGRGGADPPPSLSPT